MTFQPVLPVGGVGGWAFLAKTRATQQAAFDRSPMIQRDTDYFEKKIGSVKTAEELVSDRRLMRVTLGAFGLDDDIDSRFFIKKILEGGSIDPKSLANRMADKRYLNLAKTFGFGDVTPPHSAVSDFGKRITSAYRDRQFEAAVGETEPDLRLAMSLDRDLGDIAAKTLSKDGKWFTLMANPPLRTVFERVLSLPTSIGALDLDVQLRTFKDKASRMFGTDDLASFADPAKVSDLRTKFLARSDAATGASSQVRGSAALTLLQGMASTRSLMSR